jgi:hypothetical protein
MTSDKISEIFKGTTIPPLPEGFIDKSSNNDMMVRMTKKINDKLSLELWVNYDRVEDREVFPEYKYSLDLYNDQEDVAEIDLLQTNNLAEVYEMINQYL